MKNILLIVRDANKHGTISSLDYSLFRALEHCGNRVSVCILHDIPFETEAFPYPRERLLLLENSTNTHILKKAVKFVQKLLILRRFCKKNKFDVVIGDGGSTTISAILANWNGENVGFFHTRLWREKRADHPWLRYIVETFANKFLWKRLTRLCAISALPYNSIKEFYAGTPVADRVRVAYNVYDYERYEQRALESLPENCVDIFKKPTLVWIARLDYNKNPERLIRAFAQLPKTLRECTNLVLAGTDNGEMQPFVLALAKDLGVENNVFYIGPCANPYPLMARARASLSTSYSEGLPTIHVEALTLNTPIITTNSTAGNWEVLSCIEQYDEHLKSNFIAEKGIITPNRAFREETEENKRADETDFSKAIEMILSDEVLYKKMKSAPFRFREIANAEETVKTVLGE